MTSELALQEAVKHYAAYQDLVRLNSKASPSGCWIWTGAKGPCGYGVIRVLGARVLAHRLSLSVFKGMPEGSLALHSCDNPPCVNPEHLRAGSHLDNVRDMDSRGRRVRSGPASQLGGDNHNARVTEGQVQDVRRLKLEGRSYSEIERLTGVKRANAWAIATRKSWSHISSDDAGERERRERPRGFDGKVRPRPAKEA